MKKIMFYLMSIAMIICSCTAEDTSPTADNVSPCEKTTIMFFPWSSNLLPYFKRNISDFEKAAKSTQLDNQRILICLSTSATKSTLFELKIQNGQCTHDTIKHYENPDFTSANGITSLLCDIKTISPSNQYSLIVGCHGMGWVPVTSATRGQQQIRYHWDVEGDFQTRYFGGLSSQYQINTTTLSKAISDANMKMEYILFDDCYMSSIEAAYDLKDVTHYIIACPTEVMICGFPYATAGKCLLGTPDYEAVCNSFYQFYSTYAMPCGTIGVTDCTQLDNLAQTMKKINAEFDENNISTNNIQRMDGYTPILFYDYGDYVTKLCTDSTLLEEFRYRLDLAVPYKSHTTFYYSSLKGPVRIKAFSGVTTSDPSMNTLSEQKISTKWYKATHNAES